MKKFSFVAILLCLSMLFSGFSTQVAISKDSFDSDNLSSAVKYLTEEEVFEALAFTYGDSVLAEAIDAQKTQAPNGFIIKEFHSENYSKYTNDDYAGMYLNDGGQLVICYRSGSKSAKTMQANNRKASAKLLTDTGKVLVDSVAISEVKFSNAELSGAYEHLNRTADKYKIIKEFWIDIENNKVVVGIFEDAKTEQIKKELLSVLGEDMISFVHSDPKDEIKEIATINGTSAINNQSAYSTPAGQMWSPSKGYYGIITCGHGYSNNQNIYTGKTGTGTLIGQIKDRYYNDTNDSSFIKLNSGHSYSGTAVDEISTQVPVVNSYITLRGCNSGSKSAKVTSTNASYTSGGTTYSNMLKTDYEMQSGDSGGGAIGGFIDGGRTNLIVGINKSVTSGVTYLIKGEVIWNAYK